MKQMSFNCWLQGIKDYLTCSMNIKRIWQLKYINEPWTLRDFVVLPSLACAGKQSSSFPYSSICLEAYLHKFYRFYQSSKKQYIDPEDPMPPPEHNANGLPTSVAPHLRMMLHIKHMIQKPRWCKHQISCCGRN